MTAPPFSPTPRQWVLALAARWSATGVEMLLPPDVAPTHHRQSIAVATQALDSKGIDSRASLDAWAERQLAAGRPWETCDLVRTVAAAVRTGLMTSHDAWPMLFRAAREMQRRFSSWKDFGEAYVIDFEGITDGRASCRAEIDGLLGDPAGPWRVLPWTLSLDDIGSPAPTPR